MHAILSARMKGGGKHIWSLYIQLFIGELFAEWITDRLLRVVKLKNESAEETEGGPRPRGTENDFSKIGSGVETKFD